MPSNASNRVRARLRPLASAAAVHPVNLLACAFALAPAIVVLAPKATVPLLLVACAAMLPGALARGWRPARPGMSVGLVLAGLTALWAAVSASWSFDPAKGWDTLAGLLALVLATWLIADVVAQVRAAHRDALAALARGAGLGLLAGAGVMVVELALDQPILRTLTWQWSPDAVSPAETNRGGTFLFVTALMAVPLFARAGLGRGVQAAGVAALGAAAVLSDSGANQVGLLAGGAFLALAGLGRPVRTTLWALAALLGLLAMPWLVQLPYEHGLHQAEALPFSAQHRLHIWHFAGEWALERPVAGWGFDSSADFPNRGVEPFTGSGDVIPLHPHNAALQLWLETGAVGVLLALGLLAALVRRIESAGPTAARWLGAAAMTTFVVADIGYGAWQTHWIATICWFFCYAAALWPRNTKRSDAGL
jgi:O-antigen ligase